MHHTDAYGSGSSIVNDALKMGKLIKFQSLCPATAHLRRWSISRKSDRQII